MKFGKNKVSLEHSRYRAKNLFFVALASSKFEYLSELNSGEKMKKLLFLYKLENV